MQDVQLSPKQSKKIAYEQMAEEENITTAINLGNEYEPVQTNPASNVESPMPAGVNNNNDVENTEEVVYQSDTKPEDADGVDIADDRDNDGGETKTKDADDDGPPPGMQLHKQLSLDDPADWQDTPESERLYILEEKDQDVVSKTKNKKNPNSRLNSVDPNWDYNITIGDVEKRRISHLPGKDPSTTKDIWFPRKGAVRKVFVAIKVKRVSDVDNVAETFRMRFHIYFNWLMTESDYRSYLEAKRQVDENKNYEPLLKWEPSWYPHLEFQNAIEEHIKEWEIYPEQGRFRLQEFKDFAKEKKAKIPENQFDCECAKFIRAKLECEMTFAEELELQSFPFDCQDLSCIIHERTQGSNVKCRFLPELRKPNFASIDPRYSVIDEWDLETAILEFGDASASASRSKTSYAMIVLRLKMKRRWKVFLWNIVFLMFCICALALCSFALNVRNDLGERLNLIITLVLTAVAFSYVVFDNLPNVPYLTYMDKYILACYMFLVGTMVESALAPQFPALDPWFFLIFFIIFISYHVGFGWYATKIRQEEESKLYLSSDDVELEVNLSRPSLEFNYQQRLRAGINGRLLSFLGTIKIPDTMKEEEQQKLRVQQEKLKEIYEQKAAKMEQAQHFHNDSLIRLGDEALPIPKK